MYVFGIQIDRQQKIDRRQNDRERENRPIQKHTIVKERTVLSVFGFRTHSVQTKLLVCSMQQNRRIFVQDKEEKKKKRITFTRIEHHTMQITKRKKKKAAIISTKIDTLLQLNERNGIEQRKQDDLTKYKKLMFMFFLPSSSNEHI